MSELTHGTLLANKYRVERLLGRGGMGIVVEAFHLALEQVVALKVLLPEVALLPGASARFLREARAAARLQSEHVVRVLDVDTLPDGRPFIVMEHLVGMDLHRLSRARGPLPVADVAGFFVQICAALAEAHALGIVHRDLKPSNVFLAQRRDGSSLVKLLDFGIAKAPQAWSAGELTRGSVLGSPSYMSLEQLRDTSVVDHRSDIWSLGVMLHELLTLRHPFEASSETALGAMVATAEPTPLRVHRPELPAALEQIVLRCLAKRPVERYPDVGALAAALAPFATDAAPVSIARIATLAEVSSPATARFSAEPTPASAVSRAEPSRVPSSVRAPTENFRRQHEELATRGAEILQALEGDDASIVAQAVELRRKVARFAGKLKMHASMETDALYPRLLAHADPVVRKTAGALLREVRDLYSAFDHYSARWPDGASIEAEPRAFVKDTRKVLKALWLRMGRENQELYPLVDAAG